jgi:putative oxidoreductase
LGLLILRFATGLSLATTAHVMGALADTANLLDRCLVGGVIMLLWIGLWTPIAAVTAAAIQVAILSLAQFNSAAMITAAVGVALAMLGPGAWSLDARLFGRKRIV